MFKLESWTSRVEARALEEHRSGRSRQRSRSKSASGRQKAVSFSDECGATVCTGSPRKISHNACGGTVIYTANMNTSSARCGRGTFRRPLFNQSISVLFNQQTSICVSLDSTIPLLCSFQSPP